jgi:integrase
MNDVKARQLIDLYLEEQTLAWAPSTLKSESHRLNALVSVLDGDAFKLWEATSKLAPYSRGTSWVRVISFYDWAIENGHAQGPNPYRIFKKKNAKRFKNLYQHRTPTIGYTEARERIARIPDEAIRNKAFQLLSGGLRYTESFTLCSGMVVGKGNKERRVFPEKVEGPIFEGCYRSFLRALRKVGLKPHDLRKIMATELARRGLREADMCKIFGWASFATAKSYIGAHDEEVLEAFLKNVQQGGCEDETKQVPGEVQEAS